MGYYDSPLLFFLLSLLPLPPSLSSLSLLSSPLLSSPPLSLLPPSQLEGERNYHIFYRLLAGMPKQTLAKLHLVKNPREYAYLTKVLLRREERKGRKGDGSKGEMRKEGRWECLGWDEVGVFGVG